jgi:hypothetical protein
MFLLIGSCTSRGLPIRMPGDGVLKLHFKAKLLLSRVLLVLLLGSVIRATLEEH